MAASMSIDVRGFMVFWFKGEYEICFVYRINFIYFEKNSHLPFLCIRKH